MFRPNRLIIIFVSLILLSGCQSGANDRNMQIQSVETIKELENRIIQLEEENKKLTSLYNDARNQLKSISQKNSEPLGVSYIGYEQKYRFIKDRSSILWMPVDDSPVVGGLSNTLVEVLFAGYTTEDNIWLFVLYRTYDTPANNRGWILEKNTLKYTKECQKLMSDVIILKGIIDVDNNPASIEDYDRYGMIEKRKDDKVLVMFAGGDEHWYYEKDLSYPPIE